MDEVSVEFLMLFAVFALFLWRIHCSGSGVDVSILLKLYCMGKIVEFGGYFDGICPRFYIRYYRRTLVTS